MSPDLPPFFSRQGEKMSRQIWMKKARSFSDARYQDFDYYLNMSAQERLEVVQFLRESYSKFHKKNKYESGKRLRRTVRVIQQA